MEEDSQNIPFFTVITPTLNIEKYITNCLQSVSFQSFKNFEHLIIDGNSSDGTLEILNKYKQNCNYDVRILSRAPEGISDAFNYGVKNAHGHYIIFLNGDDHFYSSRSLEAAHAVLLSNPKIQCLQGMAAIQIGKIIIKFNSTLNKLTYYFNLSYGCPVSHPNTIMSKDLLIKYGLFDTNIKYQMDTDLFHRINGKEIIYFTDTIFSVLRLRRGSSTLNNYFDRFKYWKLFYKRYKSIFIISGILWSIKYSRMIASVSE